MADENIDLSMDITLKKGMGDFDEPRLKETRAKRKNHQMAKWEFFPLKHRKETESKILKEWVK